MNSIDYSPLTSTVTREDIRQYRQATRGKSKIPAQLMNLIVVGVFIVLFSAPFLVLATSENVFVLLLAFPTIAGLVGYFVYSFYKRVTIKAIRLTRFADSNGFTFSQRETTISHPGLIFQYGHSRTVLERLASPKDLGAPIELGNYQYVTGSGKNRSTHTFGYISLPLQRRLPHIVLDAKSNNLLGKISTLPTFFDRGQRLQLEGDFGTYFDAYVPEGYGADALYVFTPDVMAALVDNAHAYDLEIVDDTLYLYSVTTFDLTSEQQLRKLFSMVATLRKEVDKQTMRYADDRVGNREMNVVAAPGRRLKSGFNGLLVVGVIAWIFMDVTSNFLPDFMRVLLPISIVAIVVLLFSRKQTRP